MNYMTSVGQQSNQRQSLSCHGRFGQLAHEGGERFPLLVLQSMAGYYIGTLDDDLCPYSRESVEYFPSKEVADNALTTGEWTQRENP